ncbi:MAG TPA: TolC family protein [Gemmatimonadaceae bacterium]|nr:TolC family protein [Gemmatimonadaceae bacterium]
MDLHLKKLIAAFTVALVCALGSDGVAQVARTTGGPAETLTLEAAVEGALLANADVLVARLRVDSARAERRIAGAYPNPTFTATPSNPSQYTVQLPLDIWPARQYRARIGDRGESAARSDVDDTKRQVVFAVRQAFYDVLLADSLRTLADDQADTFRRLLAADSTLLRSGSIAERDVVTTRLQLAHAMATVSRALVQQHATRLTLEALLGAPKPDTSLRITGHLAYRPLDINGDSVLALALARRPDLAAATDRLAQSSAAQALARATLVPVPVAGAVYQPAAPFASGQHVAPSLGLTLPVLNIFGGERARAAAGEVAAQVALNRTRMQIRSDVALAFDGYATARELADRYACGLLADAAGALEAAQYAYQRGASGLPDLLEAIRAYADTRSDYLTALHDYWVSVFALERATGLDFVEVSR